jgi:hypothetical protein
MEGLGAPKLKKKEHEKEFIKAGFQGCNPQVRRSVSDAFQRPNSIGIDCLFTQSLTCKHTQNTTHKENALSTQALNTFSMETSDSLGVLSFSLLVIAAFSGVVILLLFVFFLTILAYIFAFIQPLDCTLASSSGRAAGSFCPVLLLSLTALLPSSSFLLLLAAVLESILGANGIRVAAGIIPNSHSVVTAARFLCISTYSTFCSLESVNSIYSPTPHRTHRMHRTIC